MDERLAQRLEHARPQLQVVWAALNVELDKLAFAPGTITLRRPEEAAYRLDRDPASGLDTLVGIWRDARGQKCGTVLIHGDGSFFAEYDIIRDHPRNERWFVEAVTAWGRGEIVRSEPRLLPVAI